MGVRSIVNDVIDELLRIAEAQDCSFPPGFKQNTLEEMARPAESNSIMYQDFAARRPMEVETYLGSPIKLAQTVGLKAPRIETLYALLHNLNITNQQKPKETQVAPATNGNPQYTARLSSAPAPRPPMNGMSGGPNGMMNGMGRGRPRNASMGPQSGPMPGMRRGGPMNGGPNNYGRPIPNGYGGPPPSRGQQSRRGSIDNDLGDEFSHLVLYDDIPEGDGLTDELTTRERELVLRQREIGQREQELRMRRGGGPGGGPRRGAPTPSVRNGGFDDDDDDDEYVDPTNRPAPQLIDPDNFDMMSVTSRRNRKAPSASQIRNNPESDSKRGGGFGRPMFNRNRSSARMIGALPGAHDSLMDDPLMGYSSNRYGAVDRQSLGHNSRATSLTTARLDELQFGGGPQNGPYPRRTSQSPGTLYSPQMSRGNGRRPSPPNGHMGYPPQGRPSPPGGMRQPIPQYPPGQGNTVAPQQVEQQAGVSVHNLPKGPITKRSLTGSASASAGSGDSGASAHLDSENSAHSSQSSLGPRFPGGVR